MHIRACLKTDLYRYVLKFNYARGNAVVDSSCQQS